MIRDFVQPESRLTQNDCAYNLFRNKRHPAIICAVPEDRTVPGFITGKAWSFGGKVADRAQQPPGFDQAAAQVAVRFNGFYLFQLTGAKIVDMITGDERKPAAALYVLSHPTRRVHSWPPQRPAAKRPFETPAFAQRSMCG
jgi:hypothetical protein